VGKLLAIILFALLGCASNKPVPSQAANADDDPRCKEFYKAMEDVSRDYEIKDFLKIFEASYRPEITCLEAITCSEIVYCIHRQGFP
jgi:hypothetical protein